MGEGSSTLLSSGIFPTQMKNIFILFTGIFLFAGCESPLDPIEPRTVKKDEEYCAQFGKVLNKQEFVTALCVHPDEKK